MAPLVKCLPCKQKNPNSTLRTHVSKGVRLGISVCNPRVGEEMGGAC